MYFLLNFTWHVEKVFGSSLKKKKKKKETTFIEKYVVNG